MSSVCRSIKQMGSRFHGRSLDAGISPADAPLITVGSKPTSFHDVIVMLRTYIVVDKQRCDFLQVYVMNNQPCCRCTVPIVLLP